jgi:signal transduction histidine kinase
MMPEWLIVLSPDGTVLAVSGEVPAGWVGLRVEDQPDAPEELRRLVAETRRQFNASSSRSSLISATITLTAQPVRILLLEAVPVRRVDTDLRALLQSAIRVMEQQARALEVALTLDVGRDVPRIWYVDADKIAWTITALVGNALRFVRRGTRLRPGGTIQVRARFASARVVLEVQDDGPGMPPEAVSEVFRRPAGKLHASGLGLTLIQEIIAAHGGAVELESSTQLDRSGTTVRLFLPCP